MFDWVQNFLDWCSSLGEVGLFALAFVESSFFPVPPDFLYIPMVLNGDAHPYVLASVCTVGSVLGALFGYVIGKYAGRPLVQRFVKQETIDKADSLFDQYGSAAILVAAFTPVPYKVFAIAAGINRMKILPFVLYSILGRGGRFFTVIYLLNQFGEAIIHNFFNISLAVAVLGIASFILFRWYRNKTK